EAGARESRQDRGHAEGGIPRRAGARGRRRQGQKAGRRLRSVPAARAERAPAKVNLTLRVIGRRADGYHEIESLVVFASLADALAFTPGRSLALAVRGPTALSAGAIADNLVLKAAHALAERAEGLRLGRFILSKRLPVAAGLRGGSAAAAPPVPLPARPNRAGPPDSPP